MPSPAVGSARAKFFDAHRLTGRPHHRRRQHGHWHGVRCPTRDRCRVGEDGGGGAGYTACDKPGSFAQVPKRGLRAP
jgi:hypothetical protein